VNTLANRFGVNEPRRGRNAISGSIIIIERLRPSCQNFVCWLPGGEVLRSWARSASGDTAEGISLIEDGIEDTRATGSTLMVPLFLAPKAEALHLADRTSEALEAIREAEA
jgi:hypothetical protein